MNSNVGSAKIDHKNDNNNNSDATYEFQDPSGERSMPTTLCQPASKRVLPQTLQKKYHDLWLQNIYNKKHDKTQGTDGSQTCMQYLKTAKILCT